MLEQTATVFRGRLKSVQFTYEDCAGPRTQYGFSGSVSLLGTPVEPTVTLKVFGGPMPDGEWLQVSELPPLVTDAEYVVFLRNTDWTFSPVVGDLALRVETIAGKEVLIHPGGHAVTAWGPEGPVLSQAAVSERVGSKRRGYKGAEVPAKSERPASGRTDAQGEVRPPDSPEPAPQPARDSLLASAPGTADLRKLGLFARPALVASAIAHEPTAGIDAFTAAVRETAAREQLRIGGRLTLDPNWKCWSSTRTAKAGPRIAEKTHL